MLAGRQMRMAGRRNAQQGEGRRPLEHRDARARPARSAGYRRICGILAGQYGLRPPYGLDRRPRRRFGNLPLLRLAKRIQLYAPGGLSVVQLCVREWRRVVRALEPRFVEHGREHRLSARLPRKSRQSDERQRV